MAVDVDSVLAEALDQYLTAMQAGDRIRCAELMRDHPALLDHVNCLETLHVLREGEPRVTTDGVIGSLFGKYRIEAELGRGGMGVVYRADQADLCRKVALKMILHGQLASAKEVERFLDEARAAARIQHPNVVQVYEVGESAGRHFLAMELIEGTSLERLIAEFHRTNTLPTPEQAVCFMLPLVRAVEHLHQQGIVHRDLKPGNILIPGKSESDSTRTVTIPRTCAELPSLAAKISDFGLAKSIAGSDPVRTQSGVIVGTPSYMAPEQAASKRDLTRAVDLYALGAILYELLTGQPPFRAATPLDTLVLVLESEPARPKSLRPAIPRDLEAIVLKCLEKDPARRYASAGELAADLERFLAHEPVKARPLSISRRLAHWTRREPALASRVGALVVFAGVVQLNYHLSGNVALELHLSVMGLLGAWVLISFGFQMLLRREADRIWVACAWSAVDILIYSLVLMARGVETGPLIIGYPILVAMSGLWFLVPVVWFTTIAAELGLLALLPYWHGWEYIRDNPHHPFLILGMVAVLGMVIAFQVRRVRRLSRFYGTRPWST
jgi:serine/threonine-protein kinase